MSEMAKLKHMVRRLTYEHKRAVRTADFQLWWNIHGTVVILLSGRM